MRKINTLLLWWLTPKLPAIHLADKVGFVKKHIFHPVKRRVARYYLFLLQKLTGIKVIAITGSAGKTTIKEMLASILKESGKTVHSEGNIDPVYNIPSTILKTAYDTKYLVLEMGVEYPGEMDFYLWLAKPDIGVITNIFPTHTEFLGSIEGVFKEKSKLALHLGKDGTVVLNSGDKKLKGLTGLDARIVWFKDDINPLVQNANAARAVAEIFGISELNIKKGLARYQKPPHRLTVIKHKSGAMILDDSYNSNPWAALSTLEFFNKLAKNLPAGRKGEKIAVLGDMLELGDFDETAHRELGRQVAKADFTVVIGVGKSSKFLIDEVKSLSKNTKTYLVPDAGAALPIVRALIRKNVAVLVKGSRSIGLDRLVNELS